MQDKTTLPVKRKSTPLQDVYLQDYSYPLEKWVSQAMGCMGTKLSPVE